MLKFCKLSQFYSLQSFGLTVILCILILVKKVFYLPITPQLFFSSQMSGRSQPYTISYVQRTRWYDLNHESFKKMFLSSNRKPEKLLQIFIEKMCVPFQTEIKRFPHLKIKHNKLLKQLMGKINTYNKKVVKLL